MSSLLIVPFDNYSLQAKHFMSFNLAFMFGAIQLQIIQDYDTIFSLSFAFTIYKEDAVASLTSGSSDEYYRIKLNSTEIERDEETEIELMQRTSVKAAKTAGGRDVRPSLTVLEEG